MFILTRINNPNGYANSHSLFTGMSTLNLTYCYIHTNRHTMVILCIILRQQQTEGKGTLIIQSIKNQH